MSTLVGAVLLAGGVLVGSVGLGALGGTTPIVVAQVATLASPAPDAEASVVPVAELSDEDSMVAFAACMRENGVEVDDPQFDAGGNFVAGLDLGSAKGDDAFDLALEACSDLLAAFKAPPDEAQQAEQTESALRFAVCMRDEGLDLARPGTERFQVRRNRDQDRQEIAPVLGSLRGVRRRAWSRPGGRKVIATGSGLRHPGSGLRLPAPGIRLLGSRLPAPGPELSTVP